MSARPVSPGMIRSPVSFTRVPKPGGGSRTIAELAPADHRRYAGAVIPLIPFIERALGQRVFADRSALQAGELVLADWRRARVRFRSALVTEHLAGRSRSVFTGDVHECFSSITAGLVERSLGEVGAPAARIEVVLRVLRELHAHGVTGLPIGPAPSAPLANAVLAGVDQALRSEGIGAARWVDDVVAVGQSRSQALRAYDAFHRALAERGLRANPAKTEVIDHPDTAGPATLSDARHSPSTRRRAMLRAP